MKIQTAIPLFWILSVSSTILMSCLQNAANNSAQKSDSIDTIHKSVKIALNPDDSIEGKKVYELKCMVCHQPEGIGIEGIFPTLANSDYLLSDKQRALRKVVHGFNDTVTVNGIIYKKHQMPVIGLTDKQLKDVMNYILNSWGNNGGLVTIEEVKALQQ
jgi:mono/diheme cytochrome c family protein